MKCDSSGLERPQTTLKSKHNNYDCKKKKKKGNIKKKKNPGNVKPLGCGRRGYEGLALDWFFGRPLFKGSIRGLTTEW